MLRKAKLNVQKYYVDLEKTKNKFRFKIFDCNGPFDFKESSLDMVVSRHCGANMNEVFRVLKTGGVFVSEDYSSEDCIELKEMFGRGQDYGKEPLYKEVMSQCVNAGFSEVKLLRFTEIEYYKTKDDLKYLLTHTPILNYYDESIDDKVLSNYIEKYSSAKGIKLVRRLYAFTLKK